MFKTIVIAFLAVGGFANENRHYNQQRFESGVRSDYAIRAASKADCIRDTRDVLFGCINQFVKLRDLKQQTDQTRSKETLTQIFTNACDKAVQAKTCMHTSVENAPTCNEAGTREVGVALKKKFDDIIDFVCFMNGQRMTNFIAENGMECHRAALAAAEECAKNYQPYVYDFYALSPDRQCVFKIEMDRCFFNSLKKCEQSDAVEFITSIYTITNKDVPCSMNATVI